VKQCTSKIKKVIFLTKPVPYTCNTSYSGGRDQEDRSSKPARANSSRDPISKNLSQKIGLVGWLKVKALSSSPTITKKRN
jgi:hypothetical protein